MSKEPLFTLVGRCRTCRVELNRAEHVPQSEIPKARMAAPFQMVPKDGSGCTHSSEPDINFHFDIEEIAEPPKESTR